MRKPNSKRDMNGEMLNLYQRSVYMHSDTEAFDGLTALNVYSFSFSMNLNLRVLDSRTCVK